MREAALGRFPIRRMSAKYVLAGLSVVFLVAALRRAAGAGMAHPQVRTWLLIAAMFAGVSAWLFGRG